MQDKVEGGSAKSSSSGGQMGSMQGYSGQQQLPTQPAMPSTTVTSGEPCPQLLSGRNQEHDCALTAVQYACGFVSMTIMSSEVHVLVRVTLMSAHQ